MKLNEILTELKLDEKMFDDQTAWVVLYTPDKRVVLGQRSLGVNNGGQWNFFGGHVDPGESYKEAAVREMKEECRYSVDSSKLNLLGNVGNARYYSCKIANEGLARPTKEISKIKSFKLKELPSNLHYKTAAFVDKLKRLLF